MSLPEPGTPEELEQDVDFIAALIENNEKWNTTGMPPGDIGVCFEMSDICYWGATFSVSRFKRALAAVEDHSDIVTRGGRYFWHDSFGLDSLGQHGERICARPGCDVNITEKKANTRYCSRDCWGKDKRRVGTVK